MANQINRKKVEKTAKARREYFAKQMNKISQDNAPATSVFEEQRQKNNVLDNVEFLSFKLLISYICIIITSDNSL